MDWYLFVYSRFANSSQASLWLLGRGWWKWSILWKLGEVPFYAHFALITTYSYPWQSDGNLRHTQACNMDSCSLGLGFSPSSTHLQTTDNSSIVETFVHSLDIKLKYCIWCRCWRSDFSTHWPIAAINLMTASSDVYVAFLPVFSMNCLRSSPSYM